MRPSLATSIRSIESLVNAHEQHLPIVWHTWPISPALIRSFHVDSYCPEGFYAAAFSLGENGGTIFCEIAEKAFGIGDGTCSINKSAIGGFLVNQMPKPTLYLACAGTCDGARSVNGLFSRVVDAPVLNVEGSLFLRQLHVAVIFS